MPRALGFVEAGPAREHQVRPAEQIGLAAKQLRRRTQEEAELVHAVVDHERRVHRVEQG
jgi:hypothetical protein